VPGRGSYYVKCITSRGAPQFSPAELSSHPKFRHKFDFDLYNASAIITIGLWTVGAQTGGPDLCCGECILTLTAPQQSEAVESDSAWVELKGASGITPKLFLRWRVYFNPNQSQVIKTPIQSPRPARGLNNLSTAQHLTDPDSLPIRVFVPHLSKLHEGTVPSRVRVIDVRTSLCQTLGLSPDDFALVLLGQELDKQALISQFPTAGADVICLTQIQMGRTPAPPEGTPRTAQLRGESSKSSGPIQESNERRLSSGPLTTRSTDAVSRCLQQYISEGSPDDEMGPLATIVFRVTDCVPWASSSLTRTVETTRLPGFCRPVSGLKQGEGGYHFEIFVQGGCRELLRVIQAVEIVCSKISVEEVRGYIPIIALPFRIALSTKDGQRMWELCASSYIEDRGGSTGGQQESWFYSSLDVSTTDAVRYIDERAT